MRYIDKYRMHASAHALNIRYLKYVYRQDVSNPIPSPADGNRSFKSFKRYQADWKPLLLQEQLFDGASRCCYCMRKLESAKGLTNVEHVIPKTLPNSGDYAYYASYAPALRDHVIMADVFVAKSFTNVNDIDNEAMMPHTIGLSNLVVACNGKRDSWVTIGCCCNGNRKNDKIMPIMLMQNADTDVNYDANGILTIAGNDGTLDKIIKELNETTLQEIRSVWYHLSKVRKDISNALTMPMKERIEWFKSAYSTSNFTTLKTEVRRYSGFGEKDNADTYWKLLLAYDWFYYYPGYARQRANA